MSSSMRVINRLSSFYNTSAKSGLNVKRLFDKTKRAESLEVLNRILGNSTIGNTSDAGDLRALVLNSNSTFSDRNVDKAILDYFMGKKKFESGINYIEFLHNKNSEKLNLFLTNQYFRIYFYKRHAEKGLSGREKDHLCTLYDNLRKRFPVLDIITLENAILALSVTKKWRNCLEMILEIKKTDEPSAICYGAVAAAAFLNNEEEIGWQIFTELFEREKTPHPSVFSAYFEKLDSLKERPRVLEKLAKLFQECAKRDFIFSETNIIEMRGVLNKYDIHNKLTSVDKRSCCCCCSNKLDNLEPTKEILDELKEKIIGRVIIGKNIFSKTTPEELLRFKKFLTTINECNVVIDGLNVAYIAGNRQSPKVCSTLLAHVVAYFSKAGKNIVVLGRAHMQKWPNWNYISNNSKVFLTQDLSQDDPYLLYCALHCGKDTIIVSRDLMRSHLFLLKDPKDKLLFSRWLSQRLYQLNFITNDGRVIFKFPPKYTRTMQQNGGNWHIPYNLDVDNSKLQNEHPNSWLCIKYH